MHHYLSILRFCSSALFCLYMTSKEGSTANFYAVINFVLYVYVFSWKSPDSISIEINSTRWLQQVFPTMQVLFHMGQVDKGRWCNSAVRWEFSAGCTDAQIFLSIHQEKGNYDVEAGDPPSLLPIFQLSLILVAATAPCTRSHPITTGHSGSLPI